MFRPCTFHLLAGKGRQVEKGRGRQGQAEGRGRQRQAKAAKVVSNVPSLYIPFIRQRQVEKGRGRQRQER